MLVKQIRSLLPRSLPLESDRVHAGMPRADGASASNLEAMRAWSRSDLIWLVATVVVGLVARLMHIGHQPFWLDEALTFQRIHLDQHGLIADSFANRHMPSYFLLLQWISQLNSSNALLRIPSAVFGAMSVGMVFIIARRISSRGAGIAAGLLMALSPLQVQYGQEARSYTLVTLLVTIALWGLVRLAQNPSRAALSLRDRNVDRFGWACYVLGTIGALDVLSDAAPWLLASNLSLYLIWRQVRQSSSESRVIFRRNWLLSQIIIVACCVPFYGAIVLADDGQMLHKFDWIPQLSWHNFWVAAKSVYLMRMAAVVQFGLLPTAVPLLAPLIALLGAFGIFRMRKRLDGRVLLLGFVTLPLLLLALSLFKSMLLPRYILWSAAPFFVLAGLGMAALPRRVLPVAMTALLLLGLINLAPVYRVETKPRWDIAAATLAANVQPGDTILTADPNAPTMLTVLQPKANVPIEGTALVTPHLDVALARWKQGGRVWAVNGRSALGEREDDDVFESQMAALGSPSVHIAQGKEITIWMFPAQESID